MVTFARKDWKGPWGEEGGSWWGLACHLCHARDSGAVTVAVPLPMARNAVTVRASEVMSSGYLQIGTPTRTLVFEDLGVGHGNELGAGSISAGSSSVT